MKRLHKVVTPYMQNIVSPNIKSYTNIQVGELPKLPNDTYNRAHASNIDTHIKHLYNNAKANINRYTKYNKEEIRNSHVTQTTSTRANYVSMFRRQFNFAPQKQISIFESLVIKCGSEYLLYVYCTCARRFPSAS